MGNFDKVQTYIFLQNKEQFLNLPAYNIIYSLLGIKTKDDKWYEMTQRLKGLTTISKRKYKGIHNKAITNENYTHIFNQFPWLI